jgi:drug/metabolite transporter (DMT)-like permease
MSADRLDMLWFSSRQAVIPVWVLAFGLAALFAPPSWLPEGVLLLIVLGLGVPSIAIWCWTRGVRHSIAELAPAPMGVPLIGGLRRRRGSRRRDEGPCPTKN